MHEEAAVLINLSVCLAAALLPGYITHWLRPSQFVGYLLAGTVIGPQTPGFVADQESASQFAEIGEVLLMFVLLDKMGRRRHFEVSSLRPAFF